MKHRSHIFGRHAVRRATGVVTGSVLCVLAVSACTGPARDSADTGAGRPGERPVVVATNSVLQSIVQLVGGDAFDVRSLIPDGKDPHDHEPSASDIAEMSDARLIVQVGLDYEHSIEDLIAGRERDGIPLFTLTDHVAVTAGDPHVFTDPVTVSAAVDDLARALATLAPLDVPAAVERAKAALEATTGAVSARLQPLVSSGGCLLVTDHDSLEYFARRFGCEVIGVVTPSFSSGAEASAEQVQGIVDELQSLRGGERPVRAIFVERGSSRAVAEKIREVTGVNVVELPVHSLPADGEYGTYVVTLATRIVEALS